MKTHPLKKFSLGIALTAGFVLSSCASYYEDAVTAPSDQALENARTGADMRPLTRLRQGVFHMQRVQHGSTVLIKDVIHLKKPNLPPFDVAYISRDLESVLLEIANAAGESIVIPQGLRGRKITIVHSGADFQKMLNLVLSKAGYHYNYVEGVWYITRYPIRNYILEIGQGKRKGGLIAKTELSADSANTNAAGQDIGTEYSDQLWSEVKDTVHQLIETGKTDLKASESDTSAEGITGTGELVTATGATVMKESGVLPPPKLEGTTDTDEKVLATLTDNGVRPLQVGGERITDNLTPEETAKPWFKVTESVGMITVRAAPEAHRLIERYLEEVQSTAQRQVMVEARIIALIRNKETNRGSQGYLNFARDSILTGKLGFTPSSQLGAGTLTGGFFNLASSNDDISLLMQSLSTLGDVYTLSNSSLLARNNQMSRVSVTKQLGYVETEVETATGTNGQVSIGSRTDRAKFKNAGTVMSIIPYIGKNKTQLRFRLAVANKSSETKVQTSIGTATPVENTVPNLANNVIDQDMVLEYGRVYAIGGLIESGTTIAESYEPTLSQIPGMNEIFRRAKNSQQDTEFIVLLRISRS